MLPLSLPTLAVLAILSVIWRWNDFLWPLIVLISDPAVHTIQIRHRHHGHEVIMDSAALVLESVRKSYADTAVIHGIDLAIEEGEFIVFVGPSGCGKSTLLRLIAGLERLR